MRLLRGTCGRSARSGLSCTGSSSGFSVRVPRPPLQPPLIADTIFFFFLALPIIVSGFALGVAAVHENGVPHLNDTHKKWGLAIFLLYLFQLSLGGFIHFVKVPFLRVHGRTFQNYVHAMVGIFVIGISFYQVRRGVHCDFLSQVC